MTEDQVKDAIRQVKVHCDLLMSNYDLVSMRGALYTLGFSTDEANAVIDYCADKGFTYCLDPSIQSYSGVEDKHFYPPEDACHWGPDQLKSRLECLY